MLMLKEAVPPSSYDPITVLTLLVSPVTANSHKYIRERKKKKKKEGWFYPRALPRSHSPCGYTNIWQRERDASGNKQVKDGNVNQDCVFQCKLIVELASNPRHLYNIPSQLKRSRGWVSKSRRQTSLVNCIQIGQMRQN